MQDLTTLTTSTVSDAQAKSAARVQSATSDLETNLRTSIINDVIKEAAGVDISGLASKKSVEDAQATVEGKLTEQYITKEKIAETYVTQAALTNKKYATESYVASKAMYTAVDICDAALAGSFSSIWANYNVDNMSQGHFSTKKIVNGSYAQISNDVPTGIVAVYYDSDTSVTNKIVIDADSARYIKNDSVSTNNEIATKEDIKALQDIIDTLSEALTKAVDAEGNPVFVAS